MTPTQKPTTIKVNGTQTIVAATEAGAFAQLPPKFFFANVFPNGLIDEVGKYPTLQTLGRGKYGVPMPGSAMVGDTIKVIKTFEDRSASGNVIWFRLVSMQIVDVVSKLAKRDPDEDHSRVTEFAVLAATRPDPETEDKMDEPADSEEQLNA